MCHGSKQDVAKPYLTEAGGGEEAGGGGEDALCCACPPLAAPPTPLTSPSLPPGALGNPNTREVSSSFTAATKLQLRPHTAADTGGCCRLVCGVSLAKEDLVTAEMSPLLEAVIA